MMVNINSRHTDQIGAIVQFHRKKAGLSRNRLAMIAGVGKTVIYDIENGKETVRLITLLKVLDALNISVNMVSPLMEQYEATGNAQG
jgi:HTH-type transcriptional regulator/antitoxin HipB